MTWLSRLLSTPPWRWRRQLSGTWLVRVYFPGGDSQEFHFTGTQADVDSYLERLIARASWNGRSVRDARHFGLVKTT